MAKIIIAFRYIILFRFFRLLLLLLMFLFLLHHFLAFVVKTCPLFYTLRRDTSKRRRTKIKIYEKKEKKKFFLLLQMEEDICDGEEEKSIEICSQINRNVVIGHHRFDCTYFYGYFSLSLLFIFAFIFVHLVRLRIVGGEHFCLSWYWFRKDTHRNRWPDRLCPFERHFYFQYSVISIHSYAITDRKHISNTDVIASMLQHNNFAKSKIEWNAVIHFSRSAKKFRFFHLLFFSFCAIIASPQHIQPKMRWARPKANW